MKKSNNKAALQMKFQYVLKEVLDRKVKLQKEFSEVSKDFSIRKIDFKRRKNSKEYWIASITYLRGNGYGYLAKEIEKNIKNGVNIDGIATLLIDSNMIEPIEVKKKSSIKSGEALSYDYDLGINKEITIEYEVKGFPFNINSVEISHSEYIKVTKEQDNKLSIEIMINKNQELNLSETVIIYSNLRVDKFDFTIRCNKSRKISNHSYGEFLDLIEGNLSEAYKYFYSDKFEEMLSLQGYKTKVLAYKDSKIIAKEHNIDAFKVFCRLNSIHLKEELVFKEIETANHKVIQEAITEIKIPELSNEEAYFKSHTRIVEDDNFMEEAENKTQYNKGGASVNNEAELSDGEKNKATATAYNKEIDEIITESKQQEKNKKQSHSMKALFSSLKNRFLKDRKRGEK